MHCQLTRSCGEMKTDHSSDVMHEAAFAMHSDLTKQSPDRWNKQLMDWCRQKQITSHILTFVAYEPSAETPSQVNSMHLTTILFLIYIW